MIKHFSQNIESEIIIPSYPYTGKNSSSITPVEKAITIFFGDRKAIETVNKFKPDIIYTDSPLYGSHSKFIRYITKKDIASIVHLRGDLWREFLNWLKISPLQGKIFGSPSYFNRFLGMILAHKVTPICKWLEREVLRHLPWKDTEVVYQGVEPSDFFQDPGFDFDHPAVAIIQNHTVYQKVLGLIDFKKVIEKLTDIHFYITTGEENKQSFLPLVKESFSQLENVHFIKNISHPDGVRKVLSASDIYILPSGLDCCPTTVLEASLMEKPVLGSKVGGIPEIICDGYSGWSIRNEDIDNWVSRIRVLVDDTKLSKRLGKQGREWVSKKFGWNKITLQVESILKNLYSHPASPAL